MLSECVHVCVRVSLHGFGLSVHSSLVLYVCVMSVSSFLCLYLFLCVPMYVFVPLFVENEK